MTKRRIKIAALSLLGAFGMFVTVGVIDAWDAMGKRAEGARRVRMEASPEWDGDHFENPQPLWNDFWGSIVGGLDKSAHSTPAASVRRQSVPAERFRSPPASGLRVTWLGHSTMLLEIDGVRVLTDPVWGERVSPLTWLGPARFYAPPLAIEDVPSIDAVVISHDHYDHLDHPTISAMKDWDTTFIVPLGVGAHLAYWGVPESRIVELDWWQSRRVGALEIVCTPARHASGRTGFDFGATLWAGYAFIGDAHRVFFSGDTGLFPAMRDIGERLGPFDLTMIEAGAYDAAWPDWHLGPEQAVEAHQRVRGEVLMPVHWGLFDLAFHGWTEPIERVLVEADRVGATVITPEPGQSVEPSAPARLTRWWPDVAWETAAEHPVRSRNAD